MVYIVPYAGINIIKCNRKILATHIVPASHLSPAKSQRSMPENVWIIIIILMEITEKILIILLVHHITLFVSQPLTIFTVLTWGSVGTVVWFHSSVTWYKHTDAIYMSGLLLNWGICIGVSVLVWVALKVYLGLPVAGPVQIQLLV